MNAKIFEFVSFELQKDGITLLLKYSIEFEDTHKLNFTERVMLPSKINVNEFSEEKQLVINKVLHTLHLTAGLSYWKTYCPKTIVLRTNPLSKEQAEFWNIVYTKGLGEFFFKNKIDFRNRVQFPYKDNLKPVSTPLDNFNKALVAIGGGKDSIVSYELMKKTSIPITAFLLETQKEYDLINNVVNEMGTASLRIKRTIDPQLFDSKLLSGAYNGHIPITTLYSVTGLLAAALYDYRYIVMSNEQSANYGNVEYLGQEINHQWSKSEEFEKLLSHYIRLNISDSIQYFSLLRPLSEMRIVKEFVKYPQYFHIFSSCNNNFKINKSTTLNSKWCGHCPKCAFVFLMLAAYIPKEIVIQIFNKNLFSDINLTKLYKELLGMLKMKPFECVGTPDEVKAAFYLVQKKNEFNGDCILNLFENEILPTLEHPDKLVQETEKFGNSKFIPSAVKKIFGEIHNENK